MTYKRPKSEAQLLPEDKKRLLSEYLVFYQDQTQIDKANLNKKVPREAFQAVIDEVGEILLKKSSEMAQSDTDIRGFLNKTPLPLNLQKLLPDEFRVFCLMLNALKQWISAEQQATDRYLLGGTARESLKKISNLCMVTGETIGQDGELHHPVRDGRPPILLSKKGHSLIEGQIARDYLEPGEDSISVTIKNIRKRGNHSWVQLRDGCRDHLDLQVQFSTPNIKNTSRAFANKVQQDTGLSWQGILEWLNQHNLGNRK